MITNPKKLEDYARFDPAQKLVVVSTEVGVVLEIGVESGCVRIHSAGDIELNAGGKLKLKGAEGIEIDSGADLLAIAAEEQIIRGKMVRIN